MFAGGLALFDEMGVLYRGVILGLVIAAPVGPVGLLCIRRTLQKGIVVGMATGLGAAITDGLFGLVAVLGIGVVLGFIQTHEAAIRLIGGGIVLATAWHTWFDHPRQPPQPEIVTKVLGAEQKKSRAHQYKASPLELLRAMVSGLIITMTNPVTLFGTLAVVATFGAVTRKTQGDVLVAGIFLGSILWWFFLSWGVGLLRKHFTERRIGVVNKITAISLVGLALWALLSGFHG